MPTFPRGHHAYLTRLHNAQRLAQLNQTTTPPTIHVHSTFEFPDPGDLRGIPAIGPSVPGHIRGTQPENKTCR